MQSPTAARGFPLPSSLTVVPGTEAAQAAYPYYMQFTAADDARFWFYNSMHFPEPMSAFDMVTAEAAYCALGAANTRVHCLPTTLGIDYRIINGRVYIGGNARHRSGRDRAAHRGVPAARVLLLRELGAPVRAMARRRC